VTGQREFEFSGREVPNLDHAVGRARAEPLVAGFDRGASDPSGVARNDSEEFPGRVPVRFRHAHRFSGLKSLKRNRKKRLLFFKFSFMLRKLNQFRYFFNLSSFFK
jgi:hypothetical protein